MPGQARRVGAYAKLLANYASDDAIIEAGEAAELLFVRGMAFCATSDSDGYITDAQVVRYVGAGMRDAAKRATRLAEVGLWQRVDGGYVVRSWTKLHDTADEKGRKRAADRERKKAVIQSDSEPIPDGIQTEGAADSLSLIHDRTETQHDRTGQVESISRGERPETLRAANAANPPCSKHGYENSDEGCHGCRRCREYEIQQQRADLAILAEAAAACRSCDADSWLFDDYGDASTVKCDHKFAAREAS